MPNPNKIEDYLSQLESNSRLTLELVSKIRLEMNINKSSKVRKLTKKEIQHQKALEFKNHLMRKVP